MSNILVHIADRVINRPLMIMPDKLAIISSVLEGRIGIEAVAPTADVAIPDASRHVGSYEIDPASSSGAKKPYRTTADGTAIIPIVGSLVGRGGWIQSLSGVQSYENIKFALGAAAADKTVKAIVLDIDSPGGRGGRRVRNRRRGSSSCRQEGSHRGGDRAVLLGGLRDRQRGDLRRHHQVVGARLDRRRHAARRLQPRAA